MTQRYPPKPHLCNQVRISWETSRGMVESWDDSEGRWMRRGRYKEKEKDARKRGRGSGQTSGEGDKESKRESESVQRLSG